jgi:PadR family transcriptional regulator, regulatory protein AphA
MHLTDVSVRCMQRNQTSYLILGMLSIEPHKSGYDIRKAVESSVSYFWRESYGQIYPTLKRLAAEGLIVRGRSTSKSRPERQEYSLSAKGRVCLREWLALPFRNDPPRNEFLLKLFFGREAAPSVSIGHVLELQDRNRRMLATLLEIETAARTRPSQNPHQSYWMLTLGLGIALTRAALEWGESALATLSSMEGAGAPRRGAGVRQPHAVKSKGEPQDAYEN